MLRAPSGATRTTTMLVRGAGIPGTSTPSDSSCSRSIRPAGSSASGATKRTDRPNLARRTATLAPCPPGPTLMCARASPADIGPGGPTVTSRVASPITPISTAPSPRLAVREALGRRMPEGKLRITEAPAEPDRLPIALGGNVDQPALQVANHGSDRFQVRQEALDPLTHLRQVCLASIDFAVRPTVLRRVLIMQRGARIVEPPLFDRQLQEDGAQLRDQRSGLVEGVGCSTLHPRRMVANRWPDGEGFASIAATHARQACSAPRRRLPWSHRRCRPHHARRAAPAPAKRRASAGWPRGSVHRVSRLRSARLRRQHQLPEASAADRWSGAPRAPARRGDRWRSVRRRGEPPTGGQVRTPCYPHS